MSEYTNIEWCDYTFNPWWGCVKVSPACKYCYAETWANRFKGDKLWGANSTRRSFSDKHWEAPMKWNDALTGTGRREKVFCASMADVFEDRQELDAPRERLWQLIIDTPNLDWLLLTKRIESVNQIAPWGNSWPENVWIGTTVENQKYADQRIPELLKVPAKVRFLSCEPLLGPVSIEKNLRGLDWVIAGGESGPKARPMNPRWALSILNQCKAHDVPFLFKQWGNWAPIDNVGLLSIKGKAQKRLPGDYVMVNVGKKKAGRLLDGREWNGFPKKGA